MVEEWKISNSKINPKSARTKNCLIISLKVVSSESLTTEFYNNCFFPSDILFQFHIDFKLFPYPQQICLVFSTSIVHQAYALTWYLCPGVYYPKQERGWCGKDVILTGKDSCGFPLKQGKLCSSFAYQQSSAGETLLVLIIAQINGKVTGSCTWMDLVVPVSVGCWWAVAAVPLCWAGISTQSQGLSSPCSWAGAALGQLGTAGIATEERCVQPQHLSAGFSTGDKNIQLYWSVTSLAGLRKHSN